MKRKWILYFIGLLLGTTSYAQSIAPSIINSAGGTAQVAGNTHEWSVGEMVLVSTETVGANTVAQGVLQPTYANNTDIDEQTSGLQENLILYPNPTDGNIFLQPNLTASSSLQIRLVDLTGKVLQQKETWLYTGSEIQTFNLSGYAPGMYLLQVKWTQGNKEQVSIYKIEKH